MADGAPPATAGMEDSSRQARRQEPPPLDAIRVRGPSAKGLNKPAILIAAGSGVALVLVLASGAFSSGPSRKPADTKPMMSDPARPEMAKGAIRTLPADYTEAAARFPAPAPIPPPQLGPPLPGDIAAFAQHAPELCGRGSEPAHAWDATDPGAAVAPASIEDEAEQDAERSTLFFALRNAPHQQVAVTRPDAPTQSTPPAPGAGSSPAGDRSLFPGAVIPASLVTELNSESPGPVIAQVTQSIYDSATGRTLLIPQGARLIGEYKSSTHYGQSRVTIVWQRIIMPDGAERALDELAVSPNGAAGVSGEVDNHWGADAGVGDLWILGRRYAHIDQRSERSGAEYGAISRNPVAQAIQDGVQRSASTVTNRAVDRGLAVPPTILVQAGARISVIVTQRFQLGP